MKSQSIKNAVALIETDLETCGTQTDQYLEWSANFSHNTWTLKELPEIVEKFESELDAQSPEAEGRVVARPKVPIHDMDIHELQFCTNDNTHQARTRRYKRTCTRTQLKQEQPLIHWSHG